MRPMAKSSVRVPAAPSPAMPGAAYSTTLSAGGAFALNAVFLAALFGLSQLAVLQARPVVRA